MIAFPNCKINLGLHIVRKRSDGFHDLETVFYPLPFKDALEIISKPDSHLTSHVSRLTISGLPIPGDSKNNLALKAYELIKKDFPQLPAVDIYLHKAIPMGAGLGGGSADGAFMLKLLNDKFRLGISTEKLLDYSLQLGSDCPFFIINKPCFATGRGELLESIPLDLSGYSCLLVKPDIQVNTTWAFSQVSSAPSPKPLKDIVQQPIETWKNMLCNDFEAPLSEHYPLLKEIKQKLYDAGAIYASLTGSGSCLYGFFPKGK